MLPIRTAKAWGWSPSAIIREAKNPHKPHPMDYALAMAFETVEGEKCPQCGMAAHWAYNEDPTIAFELDEITCWSCVYKEGEDKVKKAKPGVNFIVKAVPVDGYELPDRASFIDREMAKQKRKAERLAKKNSE